MKPVLVFLICSLSLYTVTNQNETKHIECFYKGEINTPVLLYDAINGKVIDTLTLINKKQEVYKFEILNSEYGWLKLKPLSSQESKLNSFWVKSKNFFIKVNTENKEVWTYLYDKPSKRSNRIHRLENNQDVEVTEVEDLWAKVKFKVGKKRVEGWLLYENY